MRELELRAGRARLSASAWLLVPDFPQRGVPKLERTSILTTHARGDMPRLALRFNVSPELELFRRHRLSLKTTAVPATKDIKLPQTAPQLVPRASRWHFSARQIYADAPGRSTSVSL